MTLVLTMPALHASIALLSLPFERSAATSVSRADQSSQMKTTDWLPPERSFQDGDVPRRILARGAEGEPSNRPNLNDLPPIDPQHLPSVPTELVTVDLELSLGPREPLVDHGIPQPAHTEPAPELEFGPLPVTAPPWPWKPEKPVPEGIFPELPPANDMSLYECPKHYRYSGLYCAQVRLHRRSVVKICVPDTRDRWIMTNYIDYQYYGCPKDFHCTPLPIGPHGMVACDRDLPDPLHNKGKRPREDDGGGGGGFGWPWKDHDGAGSSGEGSSQGPSKRGRVGSFITKWFGFGGGGRYYSYAVMPVTVREAAFQASLLDKQSEYVPEPYAIEGASNEPGGRHTLLCENFDLDSAYQPDFATSVSRACSPTVKHDFVKGDIVTVVYDNKGKSPPLDSYLAWSVLGFIEQGKSV